MICFAVSRIYDHFSHGVHSAYMDMFFLIPLFCGVILSACFLTVPVRGIRDRKLRKLSGFFSMHVLYTLETRSAIEDSMGFFTASTEPAANSFFRMHDSRKKTGLRSTDPRSFADGRTVADLSALFFSCRLSAAFCCVGMFLTGVLKIAGTGSVFPRFLIFTGFLLFFAGILKFLFIHTAARRSDPLLRLSMPGRFQRRYRPQPKMTPQG